MFSLDVDDSQVLEAIQKLDMLEPAISDEFMGAGQETVNFLVKDLRQGVSMVTGDLRDGIMGEVRAVSGGMPEMFIQSVASHGYDYGGRLDRDGKMHWRSGKYGGARTFGWFSYVLKRIAPKAAKRFFQKALDRVVARLFGQ